MPERKKKSLAEWVRMRWTSEKGKREKKEKKIPTNERKHRALEMKGDDWAGKSERVLSISKFTAVSVPFIMYKVDFNSFFGVNLIYTVGYQ